MFKSNQPVVFLHIPKTAGTTLTHILQRSHPARLVCKSTGMPEQLDALMEMPAEARAALSLVTGHFPYGIHRHFARPVTYVTFLRRPVDRVISAYYYALSMPDHYLHRTLVKSRASLEKFLHLTNEGQNCQTRQLCSRAIKLFREGEPVVAADLETAKRNLSKRFAVVGLAECFDESLLLIKRALGLGFVYYNVLNRTPNKPNLRDIPTRAIRAIEKCNELDFELHEYAAALFRKQIDLQGPSWNRALSSFRRGNRIYSCMSRGYYQLRSAAGASVKGVLAVLNRMSKRNHHVNPQLPAIPPRLRNASVASLSSVAD